MAVRMPVLRRAPTFDRDLATLRDQHAELDAVVEEFCEFLPMGYIEAKPERVPGSDPPVYAHKVDYPAFGSRGVGRFLVTFAFKAGAHPMRDPDVYLLLTIRIAPEHLS